MKRRKCQSVGKNSWLEKHPTKWAAGNRNRTRLSLRFEQLERRLCLSAELGWLLTSNLSGSTDIYDDIVLDSSGNFYVSSSTEIIKYSPSREVIWAANVRDAYEIALDDNGNIYAAGPLVGSRTFGASSDNVTVTSNGLTDTFVVKLDNDGHALWGKALGGASDDFPGAVAVDSAGNVFVTGSFAQSATIGSETLISAGSDDVHVSKLSTDGQVQWSRRAGGSSFDSAFGIGVDSEGNAYFTGNFSGTMGFGGSPLTLTSAGGRDAFVAKVTADGQFSWAGSMGGSSMEVAKALAIDPAGYVITVGEYGGPADFEPGPGVYNLPFLGFGSGGTDLYISKLDLNGNHVWAKAIGGGSPEFASQVAVGPQGNIYLTGNIHGTSDFDPSSDTYFVNSTGSDAFLATLDTNGDFVSARVWGGDSLDVGVGLAVDAAGNAYVAGYFNALFNPADFDPGPGTRLQQSNGNQDGFIIQLTPPTGAIGDLVWLDLDGNGIQDAGEAGVAGAAVELYYSHDSVRGNFDDSRLGAVITDDTGGYLFDGLASGNYYVVSHAPIGFTFTTQNAGTDDSADSDVSSTGISDLFTLQPGQRDTTRDTGVGGSSPDFGFGLRVGAAGADFGSSVATDHEGNVYVTGQFQGTVDFDPGPTTVSLTAQAVDGFVAKYTPDGALVWARRFGGNSDDWGVDLEVDADGNVYMTGRFGRFFDADPGQGVLTLQPIGTSDIFVLKLDTDGSYLWSKGFGGSGGENVAALSLDADRNVYLAGNFFGTVDFNPTPGTANVFQLSSSGNNDAFVLTLNSDGDFIRAVSFGGVGDDVVKGLAVDASGSAHTTGFFTGTADFNPAPGSGNVYSLVSAGSSDSFLSKLNPDGSFAWAVRHGTAGQDQESNAVRVDDDGNVYAAGGFQSQVVFDPALPGGTIASAGDFDGFVSKRDSAGSLLWVRRMGGTGRDIVQGLDVDLAGNVYTTGQFAGTAFFGDDTTSVTLTSAGSSDVFISKRDSQGGYVAAFRLGGAQFDRGRAIAVDPVSRRIYTTGEFTGSADFDPGAGQFVLIGEGVSDIFLSQISQNSPPRDIALGPDVSTFEGSTFSVTGSFTDPDTTDSWTATVDYGAGNGPQPLALRADKTFDLSFTYIEDGTYTVTVVVTDSSGLSAIGILTVIAANAAPHDVAITSISPYVVAVGAPVSFAGAFADAGTLDTHTAVWTFSHVVGSTTIVETREGTITESNGSGTASDVFVFDNDAVNQDGVGVYTVTLTVTDDDTGATTSESRTFAVYDPSEGFVTGGGWIDSPAGAYFADSVLTGRANFGFISKYQKGTTIPTGQTGFQFKVADLNFHSISYEWLVVAGARAQFKGTGTINGAGSYGFLLTAVDGQVNGGGGVDKLRMKIWDKDADDTVVYDSGLSAADGDAALTALSAGSVLIHSGGQALHVDGPAAPGGQKLLSADALQPVVAFAIDAWAAAGASAWQLDALSRLDVQLADLSSGLLGMASASNVIWIDVNGGDYGWSVNSSGGGVDLTSVLTHEMGHMLGLEDLAHADDVMGSLLSPGEIRLPTLHSLAPLSGSWLSSGFDFSSSLSGSDSIFAREFSLNEQDLFTLGEDRVENVTQQFLGSGSLPSARTILDGPLKKCWVDAVLTSLAEEESDDEDEVPTEESDDEIATP